MTDNSSAATPQKKRQSQTYQFSELRQLQFPEENFIIGNGLLSKNSIMALAAPPKSLKSFNANTILVELLIGGNLFGVTKKHARRTELVFPIQPVKRILMIEQEIGLQDTQGRLLELWINLPPEHQKLVDDGLFIRSCDYDLRLDKDNGIFKLSTIIEEVKPQIICFDPLTKFHTSDENSPSEMGRVMLALRQLIHKYDLTVILLHHTGKNEEGKATLDLLRGASTIAADIDTGMILHVVNRKASIVWIDIDLRRGKPMDAFKVKLNHQTLRSEFCGWGKGKGGYERERTEQSLLSSDETEQ